MRKFKGKLSRFLALALTVSLLTSPGLAVFGAAGHRGFGSPKGMAAFERLSRATGSDAGKDDGGEPEREKGEEKTATRADALTGAVPKAELGGLGEIELSGAKIEEEAAMTLLPIEEVDAYVSLNDLSDRELRKVSVETILGRLKDNNGETIQIADDAEVALLGYYDYYDGYRRVNREETLNLSPYIDSSKPERGLNRGRIESIELIVGSGKQLDVANVRYNVSIYFSDLIEESLAYYFYTNEKQEDGSYRKRYFTGRDSNIYNRKIMLDGIDIPVTLAQVNTKFCEDGKEYYLRISSDIALEHIGVHVDIYPIKKFVNYYQNGVALEGAITNQILKDKTRDGYGGNYVKPNDSEELLDAENLFCIVYTDANTGRVIGYHGILVVVVPPLEEKARGKIFSYENEQMKNITEKVSSGLRYNSHKISRKLNLVSESNGAEIEYLNEPEEDYEHYSMIKGYPIQDTYYYVIDNGEHIEKIVVGEYETLEEAERAGAENITAQVIPGDRNKLPYGYPVSPNYKIKTRIFDGDFTIFFDNGDVLCRNLAIYSRKESEAVPDFNVIGVEGIDEDNVYIVNGYDFDSLFDYEYNEAYQILWIDDENVDLTKIKIDFDCSDDVRVFANGEEQKSGISEQDFSKGAVYYTAVIGDEIRNYYVSVVKKEKGKKLFVNGPDERSVFLDSYYGKQHDVLIANVGSEELTGLKVELLDAVNIKLADYWAIGGQHNDTLAAFGTSGGLFNVAKVRILPDGEGDLSGTLKVSADGQDDVYVKLIGHVGNPKIITESLKDAVQYVPYSYMVSTNNLFDWNKVTYEMREGKLPDGLQLNSATGEIYGVPRESGEFPVKIQASYTESKSPSSSKEYLLTVKEPSNETVFLASDEGYEVLQPIGTEIAEGTYEYVIRSFSDQLFVSAGEYSLFVDLWLNGERLTDEVDYTKESGSTKITVKSQTFKDKAKKGSNTIAAEFRESNKSNELKRTAQNFTLDVPETNENPSGNNPPNIGGSTGSGGNGGSGGGGSSRRSNDAANTTANQTDISLYSDDSWVKDEIGWRCKMPDGNWITNIWFRLPYQGTVEWYYFNEQGYMVTGLLAHNGLLYYLNPISDGTQGKMITGWKMIDGKWYYFKEIDDGTMGAMMSDIWIGEYYVNSQGVWEE